MSYFKDTNIENKTTPPLDLYFNQPIGVPTTLTSATSINDTTIGVASAANISVGNYVGVFSGTSSENRFYFGEVLSVSLLDITLDTPLDFEFSVGDTVISTTREMNIDGDTTPEIFAVTNGGVTTESPIDIARIIIAMDTSTTPVWTDFGDIANGLLKGIILRRVNGDIRNIFNAKSNSDLAILSFDTDFRSGQGTDGIACRITFNGQSKHGVAIRLDGGDSLEMIVQDDLTNLVKFRVMAQGHIVDKH